MAQLLQLPAEMLQMIMDYLELSDACAMRLVSMEFAWLFVAKTLQEKELRVAFDDRSIRLLRRLTMSTSPRLPALAPYVDTMLFADIHVNSRPEEVHTSISDCHDVPRDPITRESLKEMRIAPSVTCATTMIALLKAFTGVRNILPCTKGMRLSRRPSDNPSRDGWYKMHCMPDRRLPGFNCPPAIKRILCRAIELRPCQSDWHHACLVRAAVLDLHHIAEGLDFNCLKVMKFRLHRNSDKELGVDFGISGGPHRLAKILSTCSNLNELSLEFVTGYRTAHYLEWEHGDEFAVSQRSYPHDNIMPDTIKSIATELQKQPLRRLRTLSIVGGEVYPDDLQALVQFHASTLKSVDFRPWYMRSDDPTMEYRLTLLLWLNELPKLRTLQICFPRRSHEEFRAIHADGWYILQAMANLLHYFTRGTELNCCPMYRFGGVVCQPHIYSSDHGLEWSNGRAWWERSR